MKKEVSRVLDVMIVLLALCATASYADYGVMMQVRETGSNETNAVVVAISWEELQHPWSINQNDASNTKSP